jgi:Na+/H+ antiporter
VAEHVAIDLAAIFATIVVLVSLANRIGIAYPILLVLGGIALGYVPGLPFLSMPPDLVLLVFLPPLLYWESVTAPTSEFFSRSGLWWLFQLAFGLVILTMLAVSAAAHALIPTMAWGSALVLGAVVASTDEIAFAPVVERIRIPRHVIATVEGESLVNDATSLVLYGIAIAAVMSGGFSLPHAGLELALAIFGSAAIGIAVGFAVAGAWHVAKDDNVQAMVSLMAPFLAYLPAWRFGMSGVIAVIAAGFTINHFSPRELTPRARERGTGFWVTVVFMLNAFIFVLIGMQFHHVVSALHRASVPHLALDGAAVAAVVVIVRFAWVFLQGLLPATNEPEHVAGRADWSHVTVLAWSGMRGGVALAAALAIPLQTATGPFPGRNLIIFLTFCVLLATLVGQGGTLPYLIRFLKIRDDGTDAREERLALAKTATAALARLSALETERRIPPEMLTLLRHRFSSRWNEFSDDAPQERRHRDPTLYRSLLRELLAAQRDTAIALRNEGAVDNTVMRRIQRLLDLEIEELDLLESSAQSDVDVEQG